MCGIQSSTPCFSQAMAVCRPETCLNLNRMSRSQLTSHAMMINVLGVLPNAAAADWACGTIISAFRD
jgi:hypothetical protein